MKNSCKRRNKRITDNYCTIYGYRSFLYSGQDLKALISPTDIFCFDRVLMISSTYSDDLRHEKSREHRLVCFVVY
jgi:hypothetical protein